MVSVGDTTATTTHTRATQPTQVVVGDKVLAPLVHEQTRDVAVVAVTRQNDVALLCLVLQPRAVAIRLVCVPQAVQNQHLFLTLHACTHVLRHVDDDHYVERKQQDLTPGRLGVHVAVTDAQSRGDDEVTRGEKGGDFRQGCEHV